MSKCKCISQYNKIFEKDKIYDYIIRDDKYIVDCKRKQLSLFTFSRESFGKIFSDIITIRDDQINSLINE